MSLWIEEKEKSYLHNLSYDEHYEPIYAKSEDDKNK